jgi:hypothetical protein
MAAAIGAVTLLPWFLGDDQLTSAWAAKGFLAMTIPGIAGGAWLAREHGRSAKRFLVALASGFVTRLILAAFSAFFAARAGNGAGTALLAGLAAGFVPLMIFEMVWFVRARSVPGLGTEPLP